MCRGAFVHVHTDAHKCVCVNLHSCGGLSVLKWLPSKWNVPRRPWFYKETGGCREGGKERGMKREMGLERNRGESSYQPWFALDGLKLLTLGV